MSDSRPPFLGDETGDIFDNEKTGQSIKINPYRNFETQSGFELIVKKNNQQTTFMVKRKIGTMPTSQIVLTPDETNRFANILVSQDNQSININVPDVKSSDEFVEFDELSIENYRKNRKSKHKLFGIDLKKGFKYIVIIVCLKILFLIGLIYGGISHYGQPAPLTCSSVLSDKKILNILCSNFVNSFYQCSHFKMPYETVIQTLAYFDSNLKQKYFADFIDRSKAEMPLSYSFETNNFSVTKYTKKCNNQVNAKISQLVKHDGKVDLLNYELVIAVEKNSIGIPQVIVKSIKF